MRNYNTITEALLDFKKRGYSKDFSLNPQFIRAGVSKYKSLSPIDYKIDETYRFEGMTNPEDEMILYAISSRTTQINGFLTNAYGMYADSEISKIVELL